MPQQVVVSFVAGSPVEIAHMVTVVLAEQKGLVILQGLVPFAGEPLSADFKWGDQQEPEAHRKLAFVCYGIFLVPDQVVFDCRARIHVASLGLPEPAPEPPPDPVDLTRLH